jgi:hypothetical protein
MLSTALFIEMALGERQESGGLQRYGYGGRGGKKSTSMRRGSVTFCTRRRVRLRKGEQARAVV